MARRIGLFGGAFDPPHVAHAALAALAIDQLALDALHILPTGQAWHKARGLTPPEHRVAMARLAFAGLPQAVVDEREVRREGPSYTVDTLRELLAEQPGSRLFLVIGADQARAFDRWRAPDEIAALATICVAGRVPEEAANFPDAVPFASAKQGSEAVSSYPHQPVPLVPYPVPGGRWVDLALPPLAVSATGIRQTLAQGQSPEGLLDPTVARYIAQHHLYSPT
jgi:nicotinate-nucleotide adenylyltransferase